MPRPSVKPSHAGGHLPQRRRLHLDASQTIRLFGFTGGVQSKSLQSTGPLKTAAILTLPLSGQCTESTCLSSRPQRRRVADQSSISTHCRTDALSGQVDKKDLTSSDPFLKMARLLETGETTYVFKSEVQSRTLNPEWQQIQVRRTNGIRVV